jgi:hypothetical protein
LRIGISPTSSSKTRRTGGDEAGYLGGVLGYWSGEAATLPASKPKLNMNDEKSEAKSSSVD